MKIVRHNCQHDRFEKSEKGPAQRSARPVGVEWEWSENGVWAGITVSTAGWRRVRVVLRIGLHGRLERNEDSPA